MSRKKNKPQEPKRDHKKEYAAYMKSNEWRVIREERLAFDNYRCADCGAKAIQVHHERYPDVLGTEPMEYLVSLCYRCHNQRHEGLAEANKKREEERKKAARERKKKAKKPWLDVAGGNKQNPKKRKKEKKTTGIPQEFIVRLRKFKEKYSTVNGFFSPKAASETSSNNT